jgi:hypothetical protein
VIIGAPKRRSGANPGGVPPGFVCQDERVFGAEDTWSMFQSGGTTQLVMAGLVPAIHALFVARKTWMPGTRPGMTAPTLWVSGCQIGRAHV